MSIAVKSKSSVEGVCKPDQHNFQCIDVGPKPGYNGMSQYPQQRTVPQYRLFCTKCGQVRAL